MSYVMAKVDEVCGTRIEKLGSCHRLIEVHMGRMRGITQGIENQHLHTTGLFDRLVRYSGAVGEICQQFSTATGKHITGDIDFSMREFHRHDARFSK